MFLSVQALFNLMFYGINMKKTNNKYRSGGNNSSNSTIYSLNYKFDSNSIAGKISGTALDLIKRYNDFAKDAQSNNDYVNAEIFRQYAEHYRKIVTEINERKNQQRQAFAAENGELRNEAENRPAAEERQPDAESAGIENSDRKEENTAAEKAAPATEKKRASCTRPGKETAEAAAPAAEKKAAEEERVPAKETRKSFKIIEISHTKADEAAAVVPSAAEAPAAEAAPKRVYRRPKTDREGVRVFRHRFFYRHLCRRADQRTDAVRLQRHFAVVESRGIPAVVDRLGNAGGFGRPPYQRMAGRAGLQYVGSRRLFSFRLCLFAADAAFVS